ncbi:hypothetical protein, partial [Paenibacillus sp. Y412MC10]|uniref:hypothetical protein n=1 Tax=Geobacillus sp. (strain Y412MC10) TaxID=481743 RepID=UPI001C92D3D8
MMSWLRYARGLMYFKVMGEGRFGIEMFMGRFLFGKERVVCCGLMVVVEVIVGEGGLRGGDVRL